MQMRSHNQSYLFASPSYWLCPFLRSKHKQNYTGGWQAHNDHIGDHWSAKKSWLAHPAGFARVGLPFARLFSLTNLLTFDLQTSQRILPPLSRGKPSIRRGIRVLSERSELRFLHPEWFYGTKELSAHL